MGAWQETRRKKRRQVGNWERRRCCRPSW